MALVLTSKFENFKESYYIFEIDITLMSHLNFQENFKNFARIPEISQRHLFSGLYKPVEALAFGKHLLTNDKN